jgi:hypothetical protein
VNLRENYWSRYWRKINTEDLHNLNFSPNIIKLKKSTRVGCAGHVARIGHKRNAKAIILAGKRDRKRPRVSPRRGWEVNIKIYLKE